MRALGKASAKARSRPNPGRVHESLREYLRAEVPPAEVWQALKRVLEGGNESARVAAARVVMDALHEDKTEDRARDQEQAAAEARAWLEHKLRSHAQRAAEGGKPDLAQQLEEEARELWPEGERAVLSSGAIMRDVSAREAEAALRGLEEIGLIVPGHRVEERAEELALERLAVLKAEHGIPA